MREASVPGRLMAAARAAQVWLREIWGPEWDGYRRRLVIRHVSAALRFPPLPTEYVPDPTVASEVAVEQAQVSAAFAAKIRATQQGAAASEGIHLTYRPLGKNLRQVSTALCAAVDRGHRLFIEAEGPDYERRRLAGWGFDWSPWPWARTGTPADAELRDAAVAWNQLFLHPPASATTDQPKDTNTVPRLHAPAGPFSAAHLERVLKMAAATRYTFMPVSSISDRIAEMKSELQWPDGDAPVLGIHVRRGDAATAAVTGTVANATRRSYSLRDYLEVADVVCKRFGIRHIFLATESAEEIERAEQLRPGYRFMWLDYDRTQFPVIGQTWHWIEDRALFHPEHARALALSAIYDLALLGDCSAFVGAFNSEFSVLAWLLAIGSRGHLVPYVSLSKPTRRWSPNPHDNTGFTNNCPLEHYNWT